MKKSYLLLLLLLPYFVFAGAKTASSRSTTLVFRENKGQVTDQYGKPRTDIGYQVIGKGITLFIGNGQMHYQFSRELTNEDPLVPERKFSTYRLDVELVGADKDAAVFTEDHQGGTELYYTKEMDAVQVHSYGKLVYRNIYPNIDWILYIREGKVEYDFVVRPGGKPSDIKLRYDGASGLRIDDGRLIAATPFGVVSENKPYSYTSERQQTVSSSFVLKGNTVGFNAGTYEGTLVIDPVVSWATYFGDVDSDYGFATAMDASGNVYLTGYTNSTANIATTGSYQNVFGGLDDAFLAAFNSAGDRLWSTYFGGESADVGSAVACNAAGDIYLAGSTISTTGIATTGAHQTLFAGGTNEGFIAKFNSSGVLQWGTYFGGPSQDIINAIACDANGNIAITGSTNSTTGIAGSSSHQPAYGGGAGAGINARDAFAAVFNGSGSLQWSTYYGGSLGDIGKGIAFDPSGNLYICGVTRSSDAGAIATPGAHQSVVVAIPEAFLAKFSSTGIRLWGTYYGDIGNQDGLAVVCDEHENVYLGGFTNMATISIATPGSFQDTMGSASNDGYLVKFDGSGLRKWGTYYGGEMGEQISALTYAGNKIYFGGYTESSTGIATPDGLQTSFGGGYTDAFVVSFDTLGARTWASYYGGSGDDELKSLSGDASAIYLGGQTNGGTGIATINGFQPGYGGGSSDAFLVQLGPDTLVMIVQPYTDTALCPASAFNLAFETTVNFQTGNIFTAELSDASGSFAAPVAIGTVASATGGSISCTIPPSAAPGNNYRIRITASAPALVSDDNGTDIKIGAAAPFTVAITADPGTQIAPGTSVTFTAALTNGGTAPSYQWQKNGLDISGATNNTYTTNTLVDGDEISLMAASDLFCAAPESVSSDTLVITIVTGIEGPEAGGGAVSLYPNPSNGVFTVAGDPGFRSGQGNISFRLINVYGQTVYKTNTSYSNGRLKQLIDPGHRLPAGLYLLHISQGDAAVTLRCVVN